MGHTHYRQQLLSVRLQDVLISFVFMRSSGVINGVCLFGVSEKKVTKIQSFNMRVDTVRLGSSQF